MTRVKRLYLVSALIMVILLASCGQRSAGTAGPSAKDGRSARPLDFTIETLSGDQTSLAAVRAAKPALIEFWGST